MLGQFQSSLPGASRRTPQNADGVGGAADDGAALAPALLKSAIERLEELIDQETAALQRRTAVDLNGFNDRKSHGLVELTRAMRHFESTPPDQTLVASLTTLRTKLEDNSAALKMHLDAVREVSTVVAEAMQNADSDGTYAPVIKNNPYTA
jgi:hypothetical protein